MNRHSLLLLAVLCTSSYASVDTLSADTLSAWIIGRPPQSFVLIDVRDSLELTTSSIIGTSSCRPYNMSWNKGVLRAEWPLIPKSCPLVLYCASGHRSGAAALFMDSLGFQRVYTLANGYTGWNGPTQSPANLLPLSSLPDFSMVAEAAATIVRAPAGRRNGAPIALHCFRSGAIVFGGSAGTARFDARGALLPNP